MLAERLSRHGLTTSGAALAMWLAQQQASARVPVSVASTTIQAATLFAAGQTAAPGAISAQAAFLAEGVLKTMLFAKLKIATAVFVVVTVLGLSVAALGQPRAAGNPAQRPATPERVLAANAPLAPAGEALEAREPAQEKKADASPTIATGVVKTIDVGNRSLTLTHREGESTYRVADEARIDIDGKPSELAKLPAGAHVILSHFEEPNTARAIHAQGAPVFGLAKAVDAEKNTITVSTPLGEEKTYAVSPDTEITIDGEKGRTLASIPKGASLHALNLCVDQRTAYTINVEGPSLYHVHVKSVDAERLTIIFGDKA